MQKEEYLIKNACYSVTKYYLCKQNNKRSLLGRKQRSQVARSFPNRYLFSYTNKLTYSFSINCILGIIFVGNSLVELLGLPLAQNNVDDDRRTDNGRDGIQGNNTRFAGQDANQIAKQCHCTATQDGDRQ